MKILQPESFSIVVVRKGKKAYFVYDEYFSNTARNRKALKDTTSLMRHAYPSFEIVKLKDCRPKKIGVRIRTTDSMRMVSGFIAGEFMAWSDLGQAKLVDLLGNMIVAAARNVATAKRVAKK